ncbi:MAG: hypothetical protein GY940_17990 [bacterium]|nr:hypothetical protein [bacterium]
MADKKNTPHSRACSYLDQLSPSEALQILTKAASKHQGQFLDQLNIILPPSVPFQFITLEVPDPFSSPEPAPPEHQEIFKTLIETFKETTGRSELVQSPGGNVKPILEGMAWLLLKSAAAADEKTAESKGNQYIVITRTIREEEAETLFKNLSFHATSTRVSSIDTDASNSKTTGRYLFHVKDDPKRKSSFQSVSAGGVFKDCRVLKGFEVEGLTTFLPPEPPPGEETLKHFCRLVETAPLLFTRREAAQTDLTAAIVQWPGREGNREDSTSTADSRLEFLYLRGLRFFGEEQFTQRKVRDAAFEYIDLQESRQNLDRLAQTIREAEPYVGYRLELRTAHHIERNSIQRLNEQKARIEYNLAYLQSIAKPRPLLMRFNREQLPAMAAEIRSYPIHAIIEGSIKYGFQATESEPAGHHYLLIDPVQTARLELDPFPLWQDLDAPHSRFHLDPFWASHYFDSGGMGSLEEAMVFVPESSTIYPPLHSWDRGSMGQYLKETMNHWFQAREEEFLIPGRPLYVFDGEPEPKAPITISILDRDRMEPLHTRLGWLNDNLVINQAIEKEALMQEMARDITWSKMARTIKSRMEETRTEFDEAALDAVQHMADTTAEMTGILSTEINRVVRDSFRMAEKIKRSDKRLKEWDEVCTDMEKTLQEIRQQRQQTSTQKSEAKNEFWRIEQEIQRELAVADVKRKEMETKLDEEIRKMQVTNRVLKKRLRSLKL